MNEKTGKTIEINPQDRPKPRQPVGVSIEHDQRERAYVVRFPRHNRLGSTALYGPNGYPEDIGPTYSSPAQWGTPQEALAHFQKVYENFRRFF